MLSKKWYPSLTRKQIPLRYVYVYVWTAVFVLKVWWKFAKLLLLDILASLITNIKDITLFFRNVRIFSPHFKPVYKPVLEGWDGNNLSRLANVRQNYFCQRYICESRCTRVSAASSGCRTKILSHLFCFWVWYHDQGDHLLGDPNRDTIKKIQIAFITCLEILNLCNMPQLIVHV